MFLFSSSLLCAAKIFAGGMNWLAQQSALLWIWRQFSSSARKRLCEGAWLFFFLGINKRSIHQGFLCLLINKRKEPQPWDQWSNTVISVLQSWQDFWNSGKFPWIYYSFYGNSIPQCHLRCHKTLLSSISTLVKLWHVCTYQCTSSWMNSLIVWFL